MRGRNTWSWMLFKLGYFGLILLSARTAGGQSCEDLFSRRPLAEIEAAVRGAWPADTWRTHWRRWRNPAAEPIFTGFVEVDTLLDHGQLRPVGDGRTVRVIRASRARGLTELKRATRLGEERSFFFVPSLQIWIDDSLEPAGANYVMRYTRLNLAVAAAFGDIERFHTHPAAAFVKPSETFEFLGGTVYAALPSVRDYEMLLHTGSIRADQVRPEHIVHPLGVTTYSARLGRGRTGDDWTVPRMPRYTGKVLANRAHLTPVEQVRQCLSGLGLESMVSYADDGSPLRQLAMFEADFTPWD